MKLKAPKKFFCLLSLLVLLLSSMPVSAAENTSLSLWLSDAEAKYCSNAIRMFQEAYPEVQLDVVTYSDLNRNEEIPRMQTRLMSGEGPDLLLFSFYGYDDAYKLMKAQVFAPLDEFMENDENWNREDYVETVLDAGVFEGSQYIMPLRYHLPAMLTTQGRLDEMGKTADDLGTTLSILEEMALLKKTHDRVFASGGFVYLFYLGDPVVDYEACEVGVERELVEKAASAYREVFDEANVIVDVDSFICGYGREIAEGKAFFYLPPSIEETIGNAMGAAASDLPVLLPLRSADGLTTAEINFYAGIRANSENKQAAWNLLRCLLSEEAQTELQESSWNLPVSKAALEATFDAKVEEVKRRIEGLEFGELPEGFLDNYHSLSANPDRAIFMTRICMADFYDVMLPFYQGSKDFDECYTEFENFIKIYASE